MATIREVARQAGVAPMTVSRVINDPQAVAPDTRERVEAAIARLRYVPNRVGQGLRNGQTKVIALVVSDISNPFAVKQILGVSDAARVGGYNVVFAHTRGSVDEELAQLRSLAERRVDGVVLSPVRNTPDAVAFAQAHRLPIVVVDYPMPDNDVDVVRCDSVGTASELTEMLLRGGHTRIAMISGPEAVVTARERAEGYRQAMARAGLDSAVQYGEFSPSSGREMARRVLTAAERPTALVTANNFIAIGAARAAAELGLEIPDQLSIVTFDNIGADIAHEPFFTGAVQPVEEIGSIATRMLLERITGSFEGPGREVVLDTALDEHVSVAPPADLIRAATP